MTIWPGSDAIGSSFPITEHSTSSPSDIASTITRGSCARAASIARASSSAFDAFAIPTDEPSRAGFTNTGNSASRWLDGPTYGTCGMPCTAIRSLNVSLSMHSADASTPAPT